MSVAIVTGAAGLIGSEAALSCGRAGYDVVNIDNDMRRYFFGQEASTSRNREWLQSALGARCEHHNVDIRNTGSIDNIFSEYGSNIEPIIHTAAQPSRWGPLSWFTRVCCAARQIDCRGLASNSSIACFRNSGVSGDDICC